MAHIHSSISVSTLHFCLLWMEFRTLLYHWDDVKFLICVACKVVTDVYGFCCSHVPLSYVRAMCCLSCYLIVFRLVKTVAGKPVYRLQTSSRFSECITGYRIYCTSHRHNPGNADADVLRCRECHRPPFSHKSSVVDIFWTSVSVATGRLLTSAVHICCPSTWTVLYFWMEISNWVCH